MIFCGFFDCSNITRSIFYNRTMVTSSVVCEEQFMMHVIKLEEFCEAANHKYCPEKNFEKNDFVVSKNDADMYLNVKSVVKMVDRLLVDKKMPKKKLACFLNISVANLEQIILQKPIALMLIPRINLSLIKLYCATDFKRTLNTY